MTTSENNAFWLFKYCFEGWAFNQVLLELGWYTFILFQVAWVQVPDLFPIPVSLCLPLFSPVSLNVHAGRQ